MAKRRSVNSKQPIFKGIGRARIDIVQDDFSDEINRVLSSFKDEDEDDIIEGGLTVDGHSYWVVVEYGSSPQEVNPGPKPTDDVVLAIPAEIPKAKHHQLPYPIMGGKWSERRVKRLHKPKHWLKFKVDGKDRFAEVVWHPGVSGQGFIRRTVFKMQGKLLSALQAEDETDTLPDREDLVDILNDYLIETLKAVRAATPVDPRPDKYLVLGEDAGHLRDAFGVTLAK